VVPSKKVKQSNVLTPKKEDTVDVQWKGKKISAIFLISGST